MAIRETPYGQIRSSPRTVCWILRRAISWAAPVRDPSDSIEDPGLRSTRATVVGSGSLSPPDRPGVTRTSVVMPPTPIAPRSFRRHSDCAPAVTCPTPTILAALGRSARRFSSSLMRIPRNPRGTQMEGPVHQQDDADPEYRSGHGIGGIVPAQADHGHNHRDDQDGAEDHDHRPDPVRYGNGPGGHHGGDVGHVAGGIAEDTQVAAGHQRVEKQIDHHPGGGGGGR